MFRWKRGVLHGLIPFALAIAGGIAILVWRHPADPEKLGEGVGRFAMTAFLAGLGVSYLAQTGKRKAALAVALLLVAVVGVMAGAIATHSPAPHLREGDRAPLVDTLVDGVHRLRHPTLGFSILRPPASYHDAPKVAAGMGMQGTDTVVYAYAETPPDGALVVAVMPGGDGFVDSVAGIRRGLEKAVQGQGTLTWVRDSVGAREAQLHAMLNGMHMQINAYALPTAIVTVMVIAPDAATLADVLASFKS